MWLACAELGATCDELAHHELVQTLVREIAPWINKAATAEFIIQDQASYALALKGCVPSPALALTEIDARNGWCVQQALAALGSASAVMDAMPVHLKLLRAHGAGDCMHPRDSNPRPAMRV